MLPRRQALLLRTEDVLPFRRDGANWFWGSYTPVYLGVGVAAYRAISETVKGRTPPGFTQSLAYHPDVRRQVGEMSVELEAARLLTLRAAALKDRQHPKFDIVAAAAKLKTGRLAVRAAEEAVQIHGGYGYIEDYPVARFYRDAKVLTIGEGTDEVQQMVVARYLGC